CGRQVHCAAAPTRQAAWDLVARDLTSAPFNLDSQSAFIVGNKLFYQGSGNIGLWHACTCGSSASGCGATNGYMQWIAADDDNGNINDGTPHMTAIFNAYNRHGIACATPAAQNGGCAAGPAGAVSGLTATPGNYQVGLSWSAAAGATRYWVFRSEGHAGCNFGKALIAEVTSTSYTDSQVANGRTYYYNVVPAGASSACYGRAGACVNVTPNGTPTPDFSVSCSPSSLSIQQGASGGSTCTVTSLSGFNSAVSLDCTSLPAGVTCGYSPNPVTPPADGSTNSALSLNVAASTAPGTYAIQARGTSGSLSLSANISLTVPSAPVPNFTISCAPSSLSIQQGANGTSTCTVSSQNGFNGAVSLDCLSLPAGV
ncbi:MAG TPA: endopeptidase, partial [Vicinamibacteria bacterium]|nr:endopeptidase [Vicinamibacteria bacterium]